MNAGARPVHAVVARALVDQGIDTVFGLMGDANMLVLERYVNEQRGRFVSAVHEAGAVSMADGWSRITGRVGAASLTHGPGMTNALTALTEASRARTPMLVLTGDTPAAQRQHFQRFDIEALSHMAGARHRRLSEGQSPSAVVRDAIGLAYQERLPVVLDVPVDLLRTSVEGHPRAEPVQQRARQDLDPDQLDAALGMIASAKRPVVLVGRGAVRAEALSAVAGLADLIGAPIVTTLLAKGALHGHPAVLGVMGTLGTDVATQVISGADCVVAFGASLNRFTTVDGGLVEGKAIVLCDDELQDLSGRPGLEPSATSFVRADARLAAETMVEVLAGSGMAFTGYREAALVHRSPAGERPSTPPGGARDGRVDLREAMIALNELLPRARVVVSDTGRFIYPVWQHLDVEEGGHFVHTLNFASIGLGLATGLGAAVAAPARTVVAVVGDGGGLMSVHELVTAVRHQIPLVVVVCNDGAYGMEYRNLEDAGLDPGLALLSGPDFTEVAAAMGCATMKIRRLEDLKALPDQVAGSRTRPLVVELMTDPGVDPGRS